jgi:glycosyltransferase involved in cell wall biosynthesis
MRLADTLFSVGLPVHNGAERIEEVVRSVLAQDHARLELVVCDNASTDATEDLCRELARLDRRILYHRHPRNIGMLNNFTSVIRMAHGDYFRWIGDDDWLAPTFITRALEAFAEDDRRLLVTTRISYSAPSGSESSDPSYDGARLASTDPIDRLEEMLRLLNESRLMVDPLYAAVRRESIAVIPRRNILREDEVFATKLALAGPWGHVPEILAGRSIRTERSAAVARRLGVPGWQSHVSSTLECIEILRWIDRYGFDPDQRHRARGAVRRMYLRRQSKTYAHRARKLMALATSAGRAKRSDPFQAA